MFLIISKFNTIYLPIDNYIYYYIQSDDRHEMIHEIDG